VRRPRRQARGRPRGRALLRAEHGQALLETIALIPLVLAVGLGLMQLLAVGYAGVLAGNAAEAGALALASGTDARAAARRAVPDWPGRRVTVGVGGGRVEVRLRPPSLLRAVGRALEVRATAAVEAP
jgi:hypothetical protein